MGKDKTIVGGSVATGAGTKEANDRVGLAATVNAG
jgi:hypothetical protein